MTETLTWNKISLRLALVAVVTTIVGSGLMWLNETAMIGPLSTAASIAAGSYLEERLRPTEPRRTWLTPLLDAFREQYQGLREYFAARSPLMIALRGLGLGVMCATAIWMLTAALGFLDEGVAAGAATISVMTFVYALSDIRRGRAAGHEPTPIAKAVAEMLPVQAAGDLLLTEPTRPIVVAKSLAKALLVLGAKTALVFLAGVLTKSPWFLIMIVALALLVSAVPGFFRQWAKTRLKTTDSRGEAHD